MSSLFGISGPHWKKQSCLGPHIKYIVTRNHKKSHNVLSKFTILCWAAFIAILGCMQPTGHRLDTPEGKRSQCPWLNGQVLHVKILAAQQLKTAVLEEYMGAAVQSPELCFVDMLLRMLFAKALGVPYRKAHPRSGSFRFLPGRALLPSEIAECFPYVHWVCVLQFLLLTFRAKKFRAIVSA